MTLEFEEGGAPRRTRDPFEQQVWWAPAEEKCRDDRSEVARMDPALIQQVVRSHYDKLKSCYERDPRLAGQVQMRFVIRRDGTVFGAQVAHNELADCEAVRCMRDVFQSMEFPAPEAGSVTVIYPIRYEPG